MRAGSELPSATAITFRRGLQAGRLYLGIGLAVSIILTVVFLRSARGPTLFVSTFPLEVPPFAALAAIGGLILFVSDRSKGVLEYLIAYGMSPGRLLFNYLLTTVGLSTIVLAVALAVGLGGYELSGNSVNSTLLDPVLGYTVPMTYASALFAATAGMFWSTLSTPRVGMNSPVGIAPVLGVAPPMLVLILAESVAKAEYYYVTVGAALALIVAVVLLLGAAARLMGPERYLSQT